MKLLLAVFLPALVFVASARAYIIENSAWRMGTTAAPKMVTMQLELQTGGPANRPLTDGSASWNQVLVAALQDWNQYLATMQYQWVIDSTAPISNGQTKTGYNSVSWASTVYGEDWGSAIGITFRQYDIIGTIYPTIEADVLFDSNIAWDSYRGNLQSESDLRRVAIHEFGHVLGLDHPDDYGQTVTAIMNRAESNTDDLAQDDLNGGQYLYNATAPAITAEPGSVAVAAGKAATFTVGTSTTAVAYQWLFNGAAIAGATASTYTVTNAQASNQGSYQVVVNDRAGAVTSNLASLTVVDPPAIATNPSSQSVATGGALTLSAAATGSNLSYQWYLNGAPIAGATSATYSKAVVGATDAGTYTVTVANPTGSVTSAAATLTVNTTARLVNLSTSANAGIGANALTAGFVIQGAGTKQVLIRGVGPTLATFGVTGVLPDPELTLYSEGSVIAQAGAWGGSSVLSEAFAAVGAFSFESATSADSALIADLRAQSTTAQASSLGSDQGVVLLEIYDGDNNLSAPTQLANLSVSAMSTAGSGKLTAGFVIQGSSDLTVLIRGDGPALAAFGITGYLTAPSLTVNRLSDQSVVATNTGWASSPALSAVFARVYAFPFDSGSADSALVVTLPPGSYSASVVNADGTAGVGLIEIYEVQ